MNKTKGLFFTASLVLALTLTQSCSGDDGGGGGGDPSSSSGGGEPSGGGNACTNLEQVTIGSQVWAKKNLDCEVEGSVCYDNDPANCTKYGRLYNWNMAITACPSGWHLPSQAEWNKLYRYIDGTSGTESFYESPTAGKSLKANSGWNENGNGTDEHGFTALPGGKYSVSSSNSSFEDVGVAGWLWSADESKSSEAYSHRMVFNKDDIHVNGDSKARSYYSVRCIKD